MTTALIVIDLQQEFSRRTAAGIPRSNPGAEARVTRILAAARAQGMPVIHIHHDDPDPASGFRRDRPTGAPMAEAAPAKGETVLIKHGSSGFIGTGLEDHLRTLGMTGLIVIGAAVNYCVASTVRHAANLGFSVALVQDAVFGFGVTGPDGAAHHPDTVLSVTLGTLQEFARLITTDQALAGPDLGAQVAVAR